MIEAKASLGQVQGRRPEGETGALEQFQRRRSGVAAPPFAAGDRGGSRGWEWSDRKKGGEFGYRKEFKREKTHGEEE